MTTHRVMTGYTFRRLLTLLLVPRLSSFQAIFTRSSDGNVYTLYTHFNTRVIEEIVLCNDDFQLFRTLRQIHQVIQDLCCITCSLNTHSLIQQQIIRRKVSGSANGCVKLQDYPRDRSHFMYTAVIFRGQKTFLSTSPSFKMTSILKTIGSVVSSKGLDKPSYEVLSSENNFEKRKYQAAKWVSTSVQSMQHDDARSIGFQRLFKYITGNNQSEKKIEMTAPVSTKVEPGAGPNCENTFTVSFFIPPEHQENPPQPKNPDVFVEERPGFEAYVRTFGGFANEESWVTEARKLSEDLKEKTEEIRQDYWYSAGYNSPYQLFGRTNEIWFVKK